MYPQALNHTFKNKFTKTERRCTVRNIEIFVIVKFLTPLTSVKFLSRICYQFSTFSPFSSTSSSFARELASSSVISGTKLFFTFLDWLLSPVTLSNTVCVIPSRSNLLLSVVLANSVRLGFFVFRSLSTF